jgi:predicted DNA-binding ribbon-helix-helix protein
VTSALFGLPTKRSVTIAGHETSVSLEPIFWEVAEAAAAEAGVPLNALIARIDAERLDSDPPPNLTSAIRQWLLARAGADR